MDRYSVIHTKLPREFVLLQGKGCHWGKCTFCNYHLDTGDNPFAVNRPVLEQVTGLYGVLDVINSGSAMELDEATVNLVKKVVREKNIHTLWFEAHFMYRNKLASFAEQFAPTTVKFRCGVESFSPEQRNRWNKGIPLWVTAEEVAKYFKGICLLCCTDDDSRERILSDINTAKKHFEYFSVNLFCNNGTSVKRNNALVEWFKSDVYPAIKDDSAIEVLIDNTDLGVG